MFSTKVIELRRMLSEKFPALRGQGTTAAEHLRNFRPSGLPQIDGRCFGFIKSGITEIVAESPHGVFLDLISLPAAQLQKISATAWHRFQRLLESTATVCVVFTPRAMITPAAQNIRAIVGAELTMEDQSILPVVVESRIWYHAT